MHSSLDDDVTGGINRTAAKGDSLSFWPHDFHLVIPSTHQAGSCTFGIAVKAPKGFHSVLGNGPAVIYITIFSTHFFCV